MLGPSAQSGPPVPQRGLWNAAAVTAMQALARANASVDQDRRNHSPSCVAVDQIRVARAEQALACAEPRQPPPAPPVASMQCGDSLDFYA